MNMRIKHVESYYTAQQAIQYLHRINFANPPSLDDVQTGLFDTSFENLSAIVRLHLISFPFENTAMH